MEAERPRLAGAEDFVPGPLQGGVEVAPARDLGQGARHESVARTDPVPHRLLALHHRRETQRADASAGHVERGGDARPQAAPPEQVAVGDVERLVRTCRLGGHPCHRPGQKLDRRHLGQAAVRAFRPREVEGAAQLATDRRIRPERRDQVAGDVRGEMQQRVRPRRRPGPRPALGAPPQQILLVVVEVLDHRARVVLARRARKGSDVYAVDLAALHEMHVPERAALRCAQHVVEQCEVRRRVLQGLLPVGGPTAVEQVRGVLVSVERLPAPGGVREIRPDVLDARDRALRGIAGQTDDRPAAGGCELARDGAADRPGDPRDDRLHRLASRAALRMMDTFTRRLPALPPR